jgi:hypothetical protein
VVSDYSKHTINFALVRAPPLQPGRRSLSLLLLLVPCPRMTANQRLLSCCVLYMHGTTSTHFGMHNLLQTLRP